MVYVRKLPSGKFEGIAKDGRTRLGSKAFAKQSDAKAWAQRLETAAAGGLDVQAGKVRIKVLTPLWLEHRTHVVSDNTVRADRDMVNNITPGLNARSVSSIKRNDIETWLTGLHRRGLAHATVARHRASLGAFFAWTVDENRITANPVNSARQPGKTAETTEMRPFSRDELSALVTTTAQTDQRAADIVQIMGWTGLRWGELRALRVSDIRRDTEGAPTHIRVQRSQTEGRQIKGTKGRSNRTVPVVAVAQPALTRLTEGKVRGDLVVTTERGGQIWSSTFRRRTNWNVAADGRRPYDLRHTAATLWLSVGVDLATVSAWLGHSSVSITDGYLHWLGDSADDAAVNLINAATGD